MERLDACILHFVKNHDFEYETFNEELFEEEKDLKIKMQKLGRFKKAERKELEQQ